MTTAAYPGASVWGSSPAVDLALESVFIATGDGYDGPITVKPCLLLTNNNYSACIPNTTMDNSIIALNLYTGAVKWFYRAYNGDWWNTRCIISCPKSPNPIDYDYAQAPMLFISKAGRKLVGAGDKGGRFSALDPVSGQLIWKTYVGPGGKFGGLQWGSAVDKDQIYVAVDNSNYTYFTLPNEEQICYGAYGALDIETGAINWLVKDPSGGAMNTVNCLAINIARGLQLAPIPKGLTPIPMGPLTVANGVVFGSTLNGIIYALNTTDGSTLWQFSVTDGGSLNTAPALIGNSIYFGSGYNLFNVSAVHAGTQFYAFRLPS